MSSNTKETILIIVIVILIVIAMIYIIKNKKYQNQMVEKFTDAPQPVKQFDDLSNRLYSILWNLDTLQNNTPVLLDVLKNDLLKLDEFRNQDMKTKPFLIKDYVLNNKSSIEQGLITEFMFFWIQNEILVRYTLELSILLICSVYEQNGLLEGNRHQLLLKEKMDAFVYFIMNSLIYIFYIQNITNTNTNNVSLNLEINNLAFQLHMIRSEKLKLISPDINNHYDILNNTPTDYQNASKLLIQSCQIPSKDPSGLVPPSNICEYGLFTNTIIEFMKQILDNPSNQYPIAFSNITPTKENEKIVSLDKDYFGNPTNILSNNLNLFVPFYLDRSSQLYQMYPPPVQTIMNVSDPLDIVIPPEGFLNVVSSLSATTLLDGSNASISVSNVYNPSISSLISPNSTDTPSPVSTGTPSPVSTGTPSPLSTGTPSPLSTGTPSPLSTGTPSPLSTGTPSPLSTGTPSPLSTGTPSPVSTGIPSLISTGIPSPILSGIPSSSSYGTPSPSLNLNSIFATVAPLNYVSHNPYFSKGNITLVDDSGPNNFFLPRIDIIR
jgi:hypothetical protein